MATGTLEQQVAELSKGATSTKEGMDTLIKSFSEIKNRLEQPVYPKQYFDEQGRNIGGFEMDDAEDFNLRITDTEGYDGAQKRKSYRGVRKSVNRELKKAGYQPWGTFKSFNEFVKEGLGGGGEFKSRLTKHYEPLLKAVQGMSITEGASAGVTVMPEFSNKIFDRVYDNDLWGRTDNYTVAGNNMTFLANAETSRATGSRHGGMQGYWLPEGGTITKSKPSMREISLKLVKLGVVVYLTQELIDDTGIALEQYVSRKASEEFNFMIGDSLINGTGVGQPLGFLNSPALVSVAKETGQLAATLQSENIVKMYQRFYAPNMGSSTWFHNQDIAAQLYLMTLGIGAAGVVTYMPPGGLSGSPYATLMGRPMQPTEFNATLGTQGDLCLADLGQMLSISKGGVVQAVSMHVEFLTDQLALRFIMRLNARPWDISPITPYRGVSTQSPFVALDTRA